MSFIRCFVLALAASLLGGCNDQPSSVERDANAAKTLTVLEPGGDERIAGPAWDSGPKMFVYMPLVTYDYYWCPGEPTGGLAERLEPNADMTEWTVHMRRDIRWHDGVPVTAHDIKFTVDLWNHPEVNYYAGAGYGEITVIDDFTFFMKHDKPSRYIRNGWDVYYPKHLLEDLPPAEFSSWDFWTRPVGNGPYRYVRHTRKTMMEFEANPDFYLGEPRIKKLILKFGADGASGIAELKSGTVDVIEGVSPVDALALRGAEGIRTHLSTSPARMQIAWNQSNPLFADAKVRQALTHAMDRRALHRALNLPASVPITDGLYTTCQFTRGEFPPALPYDLEKARALMAEAGWRADDSGMLRDQRRQAFRFTLLVGENLNSQAAQIIQSQLRELGVEMSIQPLQNSTVRNSVNNKNFEAALHDLGPSTVTHHPRLFTGDSPIGYQNDVVDQIYARLLGSTDRAEWDAGYREISAIFLEDVPVTYLFTQVNLIAASDRIRGYTEQGTSGITDFNLSSDIYKYWLEARPDAN